MSTKVSVKEPIGKHLLPIDTWNPATSDQEMEVEYIDIASIDRDRKVVAGTSRITPQTAPSRARQIVRTDDVLVSTVRPNLNAVAFVPEHLSGAIASTGFCVLRCKPGFLHPRYLFHWVRTRQFVETMTRLATGASYPAVTDRIITNSLIPFPDYKEQQRIGDILDKADAIRWKRRGTRSLSADLPLAIFRESFREQLKPTVDTSLLAEVAEVVSGVAKGRKFNGQNVREVPYLRVANVQAGYLDLSEIKTIPATESEIAELRLQPGDVLLTEGGDHDKLGRGALWEHELKDCIHQNHIFRVRTDRDQLSPIFFVYFLQTERAKGYFLRCAKKTTNLASINMRQLRALPVPVPPSGLQKRFEEEIVRMRDLIDRQATADQQASELFNSLVQRAFRGEL